MRFTIDVSVDTTDKSVKDECIEVLANHLKRKGVCFGVGYDPREIDIDKLGKV